MSDSISVGTGALNITGIASSAEDGQPAKDQRRGVSV